MFTRIRIATGFALVAVLVTTATAFAKGGFSFITITGPNVKGEVRSEDLALTEDFFAFADFYRNKTSAPADPGTGYEITRHYAQGVSDVIFDRLHYYPETGFVFYDGIENGESEYDGEWYIAKAEIRTVFENTIASQLLEQTQASVPPRLTAPPFYLVLLAILGVAAISLFTYRLRKSFSH